MELYSIISETKYHNLITLKTKEDFNVVEFNKLKKIIPDLTDKRTRLKSRLDSDLFVVRKFNDDWYTVHTYEKKFYSISLDSLKESEERVSYKLIKIFLCDQFEGLLKLIEDGEIKCISE